MFGPVERLTSSSGEVTVLGHAVGITDATELEGLESIDNLSQGSSALVIAEVRKDGVLSAKEFRVAKLRYVPGASDVYIGGIVSSVNTATAQMVIRGVHIYFGDIVSVQNFSLVPGEHVSVVGRQPSPSGIIWASSIERTAAAHGIGDFATSLSKQSITGTGIQLHSITGTGRQLQSITGTGISKQSITGTGRQKQSITGTGISKQSITGTGVQLQSITGTGRQKQSITGTGISKQSITGTGVQLQSITGTGRQKQSITGTGIQRQSTPRLDFSPSLQ
jgi:hypothetical protein